MNGGTWDPPFPVSTGPYPPDLEATAGGWIDEASAELRRRLGIPDEPEPYVAPPAPAPPPSAPRAASMLPLVGIGVALFALSRLR